LFEVDAFTELDEVALDFESRALLEIPVDHRGGRFVASAVCTVGVHQDVGIERVHGCP
jgi:hypothetical protein